MTKPADSSGPAPAPSVQELVQALHGVCLMIEVGWIPPDGEDFDAWNRAAYEYRQSAAYTVAREVLAKCEPPVDASGARAATSPVQNSSGVPKQRPTDLREEPVASPDASKFGASYKGAAGIAATSQEQDQCQIPEWLSRWMSGEQLGASTNIAELPSYGYGKLDGNGFWEVEVPAAFVEKLHSLKSASSPEPSALAVAEQLDEYAEEYVQSAASVLLDARERKFFVNRAKTLRKAAALLRTGKARAETREAQP